MIEPKLEIFHISKPVSLSFQCLDFVVYSFHHCIGDRMFEIVENLVFLFIDSHAQTNKSLNA